MQVDELLHLGVKVAIYSGQVRFTTVLFPLPDSAWKKFKVLHRILQLQNPKEKSSGNMIIKHHYSTVLSPFSPKFLVGHYGVGSLT